MSPSDSENNTVYGLPVETLYEDWVPIKCVGSLVCLDAEGNVDTFHFSSEGTAPYELMGLLAEHTAILADQAPYSYYNIDEEAWDPDD
jgi:hypothetical protein